MSGTTVAYGDLGTGCHAEGKPGPAARTGSGARHPVRPSRTQWSTTMILKSLALAAALALGGVCAQAEDFAVTESLIEGETGVFGVTHLQGGSFIDTFTFTGAVSGLVSASVITIGFTDA